MRLPAAVFKLLPSFRFSLLCQSALGWAECASEVSRSFALFCFCSPPNLPNRLPRGHGIADPSTPFARRGRCSHFGGNWEGTVLAFRAHLETTDRHGPHRCLAKGLIHRDIKPENVQPEDDRV